jgi:hypothetical protein
VDKNVEDGGREREDASLDDRWVVVITDKWLCSSSWVFMQGRRHGKIGPRANL